jgi:hypothetical protein
VAVAALTWLVADGVHYLPTLYVNMVQQTEFASHIDIFLWSINIAARGRTVLDSWVVSAFALASAA